MWKLSEKYAYGESCTFMHGILHIPSQYNVSPIPSH